MKIAPEDEDFDHMEGLDRIASRGLVSQFSILRTTMLG
jgi:hypothetical protein